MARSWRINTKYQSWRLTVTDDTISIDHKRGKPWVSFPRSELSRAYVRKLSGTIPRRDGIVLVHEVDPPYLDEDALELTYSYWAPTLGGLWSSSEKAHEIAEFLTPRR